MLYLNNSDLIKLGVSWDDIINQLTSATKAVHLNSYEQPIKTYLRYGDKRNRIIAMPAYLGDTINTAGIKWIASFPENLRKGLNRASSVTILNDAATGYPYSIINTATISAVRTAGVTGMVLKNLAGRLRTGADISSAGIIGFGPIGQMHLSVIDHLFGDTLKKITICDTRPMDGELITRASNKAVTREKIVLTNKWEDAYCDMDLVITCTNTSDRYITLPPKKGSFQMNVSLRDYAAELRRYMDVIIVDNWKEVCREDTDVEVMHKKCGLQQSDTYEIAQLLFDTNSMNFYDNTIMFNPMGMSIYDIVVAQYYYNLACERGIGTLLE